MAEAKEWERKEEYRKLNSVNYNEGIAWHIIHYKVSEEF